MYLTLNIIFSVVCGFKNIHQKEIEPYVHVMITILYSTMNIIGGGGPEDHLISNNNLNFDNEDIYMSSKNYKKVR